eukprot:CAMPEP_0179047274 /NCGR_PEP_ID=MMETSP0796-20121207/19115_1 /TAXON_ID=73915 /ORGANISM="Pyrodinium bahamense, Strain pbaha01" /LENGTH=810 /DNA_ID=CAMNT_0020743719 /DNA_START=65 /DNA_END=2494 /DNA_ORIENTATION=-
MKSAASAALVALLLATTGVTPGAGGRALRRAAASSNAGKVSTDDRTITKVVKLLQKMMEDSKAEGQRERDLYAKYKCYCDDTAAEKKESIKTLTKQIGLIGSEIEELQSSNAMLSTECAQLKQDMAANELARQTADNLRASQKSEFEKLEADLVAATGQLELAIKVLEDIGGDQTLQAAGADHDAFMANYSGSFLKLRASVKQALLAANSFLTPGERAKAHAFLQAPFNMVYTSQSGAVVGILKQMKETFDSNLESARAAEAAAVEAHAGFMATKQKEFDTMKASFDTKQTTLSSNDDSLSGKKSALGAAETQQGEDEEFLAALGPMCAEKEKEYERRKMFRANEEAAVAEAIAILDNDHAFNAFGKVTATREGATGFLLQLSTVHRHASAKRERNAQAETRLLVARALRQALRSRKSTRLMRILALVSVGNPFTKVLQAIEKMKELIMKEGQVDKEQFLWCEAEHNTNADNWNAKTTQITELESDISGLEDNINDPVDGFKVLIQQTEESLVENSKSQSSETEARRQENVVYQQSVADAVEAAMLLKKAIAALEKYYAALGESQLMQLNFLQADPAPPETWTGDYAGQSEQGTTAINMLNFILSETEKEENALHSAEQTAQTSYEDSMDRLKTQETDMGKTLVDTRKALADAEKDLVLKRGELDKTEREKIAIGRYLDQMAPGCNFIIDHQFDRDAHRATETKALDKAATLLKATPAFAAATSAEKREAQGACASTCAADENHVDCKACLAGVSVPGYLQATRAHRGAEGARLGAQSVHRPCRACLQGQDRSCSGAWTRQNTMPPVCKP